MSTQKKWADLKLWERITITLIRTAASRTTHAILLDDGRIHHTSPGYIPPWILTRPEIGGHAATAHLRETAGKRNILYRTEKVPTKHYLAYALDIDHALANYIGYPETIREPLRDMASRLGRYDDLYMGDPDSTQGMTATMQAVGA